MKIAKLKPILNLIGYILVALLIVYAVRKLPLGDAVRTLQNNGWSSAAYAFIAFSIAMALRAYRFTSLAVDEADRVFKHRTFIIFPWLFMLSALGPFRIGEGAKIIWLTRGRQSPLTSSATLALERIIDLVTLLIIGVGGLIYIPELISVVPTYYIVFLIVLLVLCLAIIVLLISKAEMLDSYFRKNRESRGVTTKISGQLVKIKDGFNNISTKMQFARQILLSLCIWTAMAAGFNFLVADFFPQINIVLCGSLVAAVNLMAIISFMPGNVGTFQLSASAILFLAGIEFKDSLTFTVVLQVVSILTVIIWGCISRITLTIWDNKHS